MPKRVVVVVSKEDGSLVDVRDAASGAPLEYEITEEGAGNRAPPPELLAREGAAWSEPELDCWCAFKQEVAAFLPLQGCALDRQLPAPTAYVLRARSVPAPDLPFPLDGAYASGLSLVEIEAMRPSGVALTEAFFGSPEFASRLAQARALWTGARGHPPGVVGRKMCDAFQTYTSEGYAGDPLLRKYSPLPFESWEPALRPGDFLGVFKSNWEKASKPTCAMANHKEGQTHFYAVLRWRLPVEIVDQLAHVIRCNPDGATWADLVARNEFKHAEELALAVRERLLSRRAAARGGESRSLGRA